MSVDIPAEARAFGFAFGPGGNHARRTMMLADLQRLLEACPPPASLAEYRAAVLEHNVLLKQTATARRHSFKALRDLYGLQQQVIVFRALRDLWASSVDDQPVLALLCALGRDVLLRATLRTVVTLPVDTPVSPHMMTDVIARAFSDRYTPITRGAIGRNIVSSWQQSGHLVGHRTKTRACATPGPAATAYALLLGYGCGVRGTALFTTPWAQVLDAAPHTLDSLAFAAAQRGWIDYRRIGDVADIGFSWLLREEGKD